MTGYKRTTIPAWLMTALLMTTTWTASATDYTAAYFGIRPGGTVLNTRSIQFGIDYISRHGGGRLVFPAGEYLTGCLHLKSDVTLQLEEGAVLLGSVNPLDYDRQNTAFDHNCRTSLALLLGLNQHNIGITGKGTIDGQGKELAANVGEMLRKGFIKGGSISRPDEDNRPMIINFFGCDSVTVKNITLKNAACWVECYNQCRNVLVDSIRVESRAFWNNDGIDIVDCTNFTVSNSYFNSSDDGICLKSLDPAALNQNIRIQNNSMTTDASGIKFGTASLDGFKNVHIINNKVFDTYRSAVALEAFPGGADKASAKISIDNLDFIPEKPNSYPEYSMFGALPAWGVYIRHARDVQFTGVAITAVKADYRTAIVVDDVHEAGFKQMTIQEPQRKKILYSHRSSGIVTR